MSVNNLYKHRQALKRLSHYLKETEQTFLEINVLLPKEQRKTHAILTKIEVKTLYEACNQTPLGIRDRAMLAIFYGCGLRRSEGTALNVTDILLDRNLIYIRKGKHYKERYTPLSFEVKNEIENYLNYGRPALLKNPSQQAFFISERGTRPQGQSLYIRLKQLLEKAEIDKPIRLHDLRHSIATHLLQSGMKLNHIAKFLGHESMESTQIYTHIINEIEDEF
jgi:site-specific recombinase XerD